jgi:hypothetical protein
MSRDIAKAIRNEFTENNPLPVSGGSSSGGDASAANQQTQINILNSVRDAVSNSPAITKATTTLTAPGTYNIAFSNRKEFTIFYQVSNYSSPITLRISGSNGTIFDSLDPSKSGIDSTTGITVINANGIGSFKYSDLAIETLRINYISGAGIILFEVAYR